MKIITHKFREIKSTNKRRKKKNHTKSNNRKQYKKYI